VNYLSNNNNDRKPKTFSAVIVDTAGAAKSLDVSKYATLIFPPSREYAIGISGVFAGQKTILQTVRIPLGDFAGVNLTSVRAVRFDFDLQDKGAVFMNHIAFVK